MSAAGIAHEIDLVGKAVIETHEGAIGERAVGVQLFGAGRIEIGAVTLERHQPRPVLGHDGVVVFGKAEVEQIGQAQPPIRLCVLNLETPLKHLPLPFLLIPASRAAAAPSAESRGGAGAQIDARAG